MTSDKNVKKLKLLTKLIKKKG